MKYLVGVLITVACLLQYRLWFGDGGIFELQRLQERIAWLKIEAGDRHDRNTALEAEVTDLKQGFDAVEERARQELGMVKENEVFVQVFDQPKETPRSQPARKKSLKSSPSQRPRQPNKPGG